MHKLLISYDLRKQRNYQPLLDLLRNAGAEKILESMWLYNSNVGAAAVRNHLLSVIDNDDGLVVLELLNGAEWATYKPLPAGVNWLSANISPITVA